ncbi:hypothetical protein Avbf_05290 [Armadillidium vulgare]|nr:hypothetical protein Avbf_05290 [Armadillidium vulgare]
MCLASTGKYKRHKHRDSLTADPREKDSLIHRAQTPLGVSPENIPTSEKQLARFERLAGAARAAGRNNLRILTERLQLGDWFLVYQLGRNMEPMVYGEFLKEFAGELENSLATLERKPMLS